jgi:hypothetical protein
MRAPRILSVLLLCSAVSAFAVFGATPAWLQGDGLAPLTYRSVLLSSLHYFPDLLPEKTWLAVTRSELAVAQAHYAARPDAARQERMVFTAEQVKGRNPQAADALAPILKDEVLKRAAAAPRTLVASHSLAAFQYDVPSGKLIPASGPRQFSLLTAPPASALTGLPEQAANLAIYSVADNQRNDVTEDGFRDVIEAIRNQQGGVPAASLIALDRRVLSDGIVLPKNAAEAVLEAGKRHEGQGMSANVVFTIDGAAQGPSKRVLMARLVHVTITDPDSRIIASYQATDFPAAQAAPTAPVVATAPTFDIVGVSLGMPATEVDRILQSHMPVGSIFRREKGRDVGAQPVAYDAMKVYLSEDTRELILVYFDPTTSDTVSAVRRWVALDHNATPDSVRSRLIAKYGPPGQTLPNSGGWTWGKAGGCQYFGDTQLRVENLDRVRGTPRTDQAFRQALQKAVDIRRFGYKPGNVLRCGLAVTSRVENGGLLTTLFDQRATSNRFYPEPPPKPVKPPVRQQARPAPKPAAPVAPRTP